MPGVTTFCIFFIREAKIKSLEGSTGQVSNTVPPIQRRLLDVGKGPVFKGLEKEHLKMLQQKLLLTLFYS